MAKNASFTRQLGSLPSRQVPQRHHAGWQRCFCRHLLAALKHVLTCSDFKCAGALGLARGPKGEGKRRDASTQHDWPQAGDPGQPRPYLHAIQKVAIATPGFPRRSGEGAEGGENEHHAERGNAARFSPCEFACSFQQLSLEV